MSSFVDNSFGRQSNSYQSNIKKKTQSASSIYIKQLISVVKMKRKNGTITQLFTNLKNYNLVILKVDNDDTSNTLHKNSSLTSNQQKKIKRVS